MKRKLFCEICPITHRLSVRKNNRYRKGSVYRTTYDHRSNEAVKTECIRNNNARVMPA